MNRPGVGIYGLTGCAGDQLVILNCEDRLLEIAGHIDIVDFPMASSERNRASHLDIAFVEGAVMSTRDEALLYTIRERSDTLVAIGTCALWGGVPEIGADAEWLDMCEAVYGPGAIGYDARPARPLGDFVTVDAALPGCPIEAHEFLDCLACLIRGYLPVIPRYPVCAECRWQENGCLLVEKGAPCLGPLTVGGCRARCPSLGQSCIGCRGPVQDANVASGLRTLEERGVPRSVARLKVGTFHPSSLLSADADGGEA